MADGSGRSGWRPELRPTDWVILAYQAAIVAILLARRPPDFVLLTVGHLLLSAVIVALAVPGRFAAHPAARFARRWYPVVCLWVFYPEAGSLRHSLFVDHDLDAMVLGWDRALVGRDLHLTAPPRLGVVVLELLHAAYFSYYLLLFVPSILAVKRAAKLVDAYLFTLTACMMVHFLAAIAFPVSGPVPLRAEVIPEGWAFIPLVDFLYGEFDRGGLAFPSTHAAAAVVAASYAVRMWPRWWPLVATQLVLILLATFLCTFHYSVDTLAGVVTGGLFVLAGRWVEGRPTRSSGLSR